MISQKAPVSSFGLFRGCTASERTPCHALGLDRADYWRFLRKVYGMGALEAWAYIRRRGTPPTVEQIRTVIAR